jgi:hypothetical protein
MAQYGQVLDSSYDPSREGVYKLFTDYFENPTLTKVKDVENYSMYAVKIHALLGIENRYIIVFLHRDQNLNGAQEKLANLTWLSLQTRDLPDEYKVTIHSYIPRRTHIDQRITLKNTVNRSYIYNVANLPIQITLLPAKNKNIDYNSNGSVTSALETYNTIVTFV